MPQETIKITADSAFEASTKKEVFQYLNDNLNADEINNLYKISKSSKAKEYLGKKFSTLKFFLKL